MLRGGNVVAALVVAFWATAATGVAAEPTTPDDLPSNVVAYVREAPPGVATLTIHEFHRGLAQWAVTRHPSSPPRPSEDRYENAKLLVLQGRIEEIALEGEAAERGIEVTRTQIRMKAHAIQRVNFKSHMEFIHFLRYSRYTPAEFRESVRIQILAARIRREVVAGVRGIEARGDALQRFADEFIRRWRARTICAPEFVEPKRCSNASP